MPSNRRRRRARTREGGGGVQPPLLVDLNAIHDNPSPLPPARGFQRQVAGDPQEADERRRLADVLRRHGVTVWVIAYRVPAQQTRDALAAWEKQRDAGIPVGPGLLFRYVEAGVGLPDSSQDDDAAPAVADVAGAQRSWRRVVERLRAHVTPANWQLHLQATTAVGWTAEGQLVVECPSDFQREWLRQRLNGAIAQALEAEVGRRVVVVWADSPMERTG